MSYPNEEFTIHNLEHSQKFITGCEYCDIEKEQGQFIWGRYYTHQEAEALGNELFQNKA